MGATLFGHEEEAVVSRRKEAKRKPTDAGLRITLPAARVALPSEYVPAHEDTEAVRDVELFATMRGNQFGLELKASNSVDPSTGVRWRVVELLDDRRHTVARLLLTFHRSVRRHAGELLDAQLRKAGYSV